MNEYFLSYSTKDGLPFAQQLLDRLQSEGCEVWMDWLSLRPGADWDDQICTAIRLAECLIFLITEDSVSTSSTCKHEIAHALRYKKPVVPLLVNRSANPPFRLNTRQYIDFTRGDFERSFRRLVKHLRWLKSPQGVVHSLEERRGEAERDARYATDAMAAARAREEVAVLTQRIQEIRIDRFEDVLKLSTEIECHPIVPAREHARVVHSPPCQVPQFFQDRLVETELAGDFLADDDRCLMVAVGRGGVGKTAMVARFLRDVERYGLIGGRSIPMDGIIYYSELTLRQFSCRLFWNDLFSFIAPAKSASLEQLMASGVLDPEAGTSLVLDALGDQRITVLFDDIPETLAKLPDFVPILEAALRHGTRLKIICTARVLPPQIGLKLPQRQFHLHLDEGLASPYAEQLLRHLDVDGTLGLRDATAAILEEARQRTNGFPRALEALYAILSVDRHATLQELLHESSELLPEHVVECLVGEAYSRLDHLEQLAMQTLAAYAIPVSIDGVDAVLTKVLPRVSSGPLLKRLVNLRLARKDRSTYYLHAADQQYALGRFPRPQQSEISDPGNEWNLHVAMGAAAAYLATLSPVISGIDSPSAVQCGIREIELLIALQQFDTAGGKLMALDERLLFRSGSYALLARFYEALIGGVTIGERRSLCRIRLAQQYRRLGRYGDAEKLYQLVVQDLPTNASVPSHIHCFGGLGNCARNLGRLDAAEKWYVKAISVAEEIGAEHSTAQWLGGLANCLIERGDLDAAIATLLRAVELFRSLHHEKGEASRLYALARAYLFKGLSKDAEAAAQSAAEIALRVDLCRAGSFANLWLTVAYLQQRKIRPAREAIILAQRYPEPTNAPLLHLVDAFVLLFESSHDQAADRFKASMDCAHSLLRVDSANSLSADVIAVIESVHPQIRQQDSGRTGASRAFVRLFEGLKQQLNNFT